MLFRSLFVLLFSLPCLLFGQEFLHRDQSITVVEGQNTLKNAWAGGLNNPQFSETDFNLDGTTDLFIFDKSGNVVLTFVQTGSAGEMDLRYRPTYAAHYPRMQEWALLRDYNCDGFPDIFAQSDFGPGVMVYENNGQSGFEWFSIADSILLSYYEIGSSSGEVNIYVGNIDIPAIHDVDDDGDLDIFTFQLQGTQIEFHKNFSMENDDECGLDFEWKNRCWGYIKEDDFSEQILLGQNCSNVNDPQIADDAAMHSGSTLLMLDINNDGHKEIVLGDFSYNGLTTVINGGPGELGPDSISSVDYFFPNNNETLFLNNFPASFYVDVNNDGVKDFIAAPNGQFTSDNAESVIMYLNNGSDDLPDLEFESGAFLQDEMIDIGEGAHPILVDVNGDDLKDLIIANRKHIEDSVTTSSLFYYENTGSISEPSFSFEDEDLFGLDNAGIGEALYPAFMDLDNDNALDMIVGNLDGELFYFINQAAAGEMMDFSVTATPLNDADDVHIDVGQFAKPQVFDLDQDGLKDLVIGNREGRIVHYENSGTESQYEFSWQSDTLGAVKSEGFLTNTGYASPHFYLENDEIKLIIGSEVGEIRYFDDIENNLDGEFDEYLGAASGVFEGIRTSCSVYDLNNDGLLDLLLGNYRGGISFFKGESTSSVSETKLENEILSYPNPANDHLIIERRSSSIATALLFDLSGQLVRESRLNSERESIYTGDLSEGTYILSITEESIQHKEVIIIIH